MIGASVAFRKAMDSARRAAASDADVLIEAESGTGKELLARFVHGESARRTRPFVAVNCAAVPENLLESELFGHARGAFTGAIAPQTGRFEAAGNGTLLLDEIGELTMRLQPKLLRVLQERQFERLGESKPIRTNLRVIATTNRDLWRLVEEGSFRLDLFYRLHVIPLTLPPLRDRGDDVLLLAEHFRGRYSGGADVQFTQGFLDGLRGYSWPGNVRELSNVIQRAIALRTSDLIGPEHLNFHEGCKRSLAGMNQGLSLREAERRLLEATLAATCGNRTRTAEILGVSLRTVRNKIRDHGLPPRRFA